LNTDTDNHAKKLTLWRNNDLPQKKTFDMKNSILVDLLIDLKVNDFNMHQLAKRHKITNFSSHQRKNTSCTEKRDFLFIEKKFGQKDYQESSNKIEKFNVS
jgi:hypothetical protein